MFLILAGLAGYLSNPSAAKTALISGGTFGVIALTLGVWARAGHAIAGWVAIGIAGMLSVVFSIRATISWRTFFAEGEKLVAALLISSMLIASVAVIVVLVRAILAGKARRQGASV